MNDELPDPSAQRRWVLYALLRGAARVGFALGVPLAEQVELLELALFHEAKRRDLPVGEIGERLDVSVRKAAQLSAALKAWFGQAGGARALSRRVLFALWPGPMTDAKLAQALGDVPATELQAALARLVAERQVERTAGRTPGWALVRGESRLVSDAWLARIDALDNLVGSVASAAFGRFFRAEPHAFARTLTLRVRRADVARLRALYEEQIWETLRRLDEAARGDDDAVELDVSVLWAPSAFVDRNTSEGSEE